MSGGIERELKAEFVQKHGIVLLAQIGTRCPGTSPAASQPRHSEDFQSYKVRCGTLPAINAFRRSAPTPWTSRSA